MFIVCNLLMRERERDAYHFGPRAQCEQSTIVFFVGFDIIWLLLFYLFSGLLV